MEEHTSNEEELLEEVQIPFFLLNKINISFIIVILLLAAITSFYLLYPYNGKISGKWLSRSEEQEMYLVVSSDGKGSIQIPNYTGIKGLKLNFEGDLKSEKINTYRYDNLDIIFSLDKNNSDSEVKRQMDAATTIYKLKNETELAYEYELTKEGYSSFMGVTNPAKYFELSVESVLPWQKKVVYLNNSLISPTRLLFEK